MQSGQDLSLFSPHALGEKHNRSLLIQFLSSEIIASYHAVLTGNWEALISPPHRFFPYDWAAKIGHLNKIQEYSLLLKKSFPDKLRHVNNFAKTLSKTFDSLSKKKEITSQELQQLVQKIYLCLEPFIETCKENENLLYFLLKNRETIESLKGKGYLHSFILKIHPCGLETLGEKMCDQYHQRGFFSQIPEFKLLLTELLHA